MQIQPQSLQITSILFFVSFCYFLLYSKKNITEIILGILIFITFIISQLFWYNPIQYSTIHQIDALIAKTTFISFVIYILFIKNLSSSVFFFSLLLIITSFYLFFLSNHYSTIEWCSINHIIYHGLAHIFSFVSSIYAFV